jgi:acetyl-CoA carboxylase carboxyl transferase subunit beta
MSSKRNGPSSSWEAATVGKKVPEGLWMRCESCGTTLFRLEVERNLNVCPQPQCGHHYTIPARERIRQLLDEDTFEEWYANLQPADPLGFNDRRPYPERIKAEQARTGLNEAAIVGQGFIKGIRLVLGVTDSGFIMGSMGSVVGEKLTRAAEQATAQKLPLVIVSGSGGGARMHEGILSLMQMAKVSAALARHAAAGGVYISVLTHPTMGGVAASFASLGDIILAEPRALIGFAGPKVIQQTVRVQLPMGFQTSEFLLEHGFIDRIVARRDLRSMLAQLLNYTTP